MGMYAGIDLHGNNNHTVVLGEDGRVVWERRLPNELRKILPVLEPYQKNIRGVVVESTFNWYWLVDGLMANGYRVHLAATSAVRKYQGLKHADDRSDACWLAEMLRLGILPQAYIYPKEQRPVRDLLRKRMQLVRQRTANILAVENLYARNGGLMPRAEQVRNLSLQQPQYWQAEQALAVRCNLRVINCLNLEIRQIERVVLQRCRHRHDYQALLTVPGVGKILALTIVLEVGDIERFAKAGQFASYCRCVGSQWLSNGKKKGEGNRKSGNKYLAWAFVEAAAFAIRYDPHARRYYQRKAARTNKVVARKAVAHKLARACWQVMRKDVPFESQRAFGPGGM